MVAGKRLCIRQYIYYTIADTLDIPVQFTIRHFFKLLRSIDISQLSIDISQLSISARFMGHRDEQYILL